MRGARQGRQGQSRLHSHVCQSVSQSVCLSACLSDRPSTFCVAAALAKADKVSQSSQSLRVSPCFIHSHACLSVCLSICLSIYLSVCLSIYLSVCLSVCLCVFLLPTTTATTTIPHQNQTNQNPQN